MASRPRMIPGAEHGHFSPDTGSGSGGPPLSGSPRERIVAALMALLADKSFEEIGLADIAARADVSLSDLRGEFPSKLAILAAQIKAIDRKVLAGSTADMAEEPARERLFDVLMRRIEALTPHKQAVRSLLRSARRDPCLALALNAMAVRSQQWMLTAAGISASGSKGVIRAQGMAALFARVLQVFVHDDDPGHARTMAALDRALGRAQRCSGILDELCRFVPSPGCFPFPRWRRRRRADDAHEEPAAA